MSKIIQFLIFFFCLSFIFPITDTSIIHGQDQQVKACDNPQVQVEPLERSRVGSAYPFLSDDLKARFTIDVNREENKQASGIREWNMNWRCGITNQDVFTRNVQDSPGTTNIFTELDNNLLSNACVFNPRRNPITVRVKARLNDGSEVNWCDATYEVADADRLCQLNLKAIKGEVSKIILGQTELEVTGKDMTMNKSYILLLDNQPVWTDKKTLTIIPGLTIDLNKLFLNSPQPPKFDSGYPIENKYLTRGQHIVSLHRVSRDEYNINPLNLGSRSVNDLIEPGQLCSVTFTVGDATNPGSIIAVSGGTITTVPKVSACVGLNCTLAGGQECDGNGIATAIGCIHTQPAALVKDVLKFMIGIAGGIALLLMALGAFEMITSAGNPESLKAGQDRFTQAIIGLLFVIFSVLLLQLIGVDILEIPGFGR